MYVVTPQGLKNASEVGYEILSCIFRDMVLGKHLTRQVDSLFPLSNTIPELIANHKETLRQAQLSGLCLDNSRWLPTSLTTSVKGLRSFLGAFKQFSDCMPRYAILLHELEKLVGGRGSTERITWTPEIKKAFEKARRATNNIFAITIPRSQ